MVLSVYVLKKSQFLTANLYRHETNKKNTNTVKKSSHIPYSTPVIKVAPLTIGGKVLCSSGGTQNYEKDDDYDYGGLD